MAGLNPVIVDTDIFSSVYVTPDSAARRGLPVDAWRFALEGARVLISFQTRAEVLAGAFINSWGSRRLADLRERLDATPTVVVDTTVVDAFARLSAGCPATGHALHAKPHNADRWHAACAIAKELPLFAHDRIYEGAPGLTLFTGPGTPQPTIDFLP